MRLCSKILFGLVFLTAFSCEQSESNKQPIEVSNDLATNENDAPVIFPKDTEILGDDVESHAEAPIVATSELSISPKRLSLMTGGTATFTVTGGVGPYVFSTNAGTITDAGFFTAPSNTDKISITVIDAHGNKVGAEISVTPYVADIPKQKVKVMRPFKYQIASNPSTDLSAPKFVYYRCIKNCPTGLVVGLTDGGVNWSPNSSQVGLHSIEIEVEEPITQLKSQISMELEVESPFSWTNLVGTNLTDVSEAIAYNQFDESLYVAGYTNGDFATANSGASDSLLVKFSRDGQKIWSKQIGTSASDRAYSIAIDSEGHIIVAGETSGGYDGLQYIGYGTMGFISKFDSAGNKIWSQKSEYGGGWYFASIVDLKVDLSNSIYVAGAAHTGSYIAKYNSSGTHLWTTTLPFDSGNTIATNVIVTEPFVYLIGRSDKTIDGQTLKGGMDIFVIKLNMSDGAKQWTRLFGSSQNDSPATATSDDNGNLLIAGQSHGNWGERLNQGGADVFLIKVNSNGEILSQYLYGGQASDSVSGIHFNSGKTYLAGNLSKFLGDGNISNIFNYTSLLVIDPMGSILRHDVLFTKNGVQAFDFRGTTGELYFTGTTYLDGFDSHSQISPNGEVDIYLGKLNSFL